MNRLFSKQLFSLVRYFTDKAQILIKIVIPTLADEGAYIRLYFLVLAPTL